MHSYNVSKLLFFEWWGNRHIQRQLFLEGLIMSDYEHVIISLHLEKVSYETYLRPD
jgi:hypothetical protein